MPFLPALAPALIGAGGSIFGGLMAGRKSAEEQAAMQQMLQNMQYGRGLAEKMQPQVFSLMGQAGQGLQSGLNFWAPLLGGSRSAAMGLMAPDISRLNQQYNAALQSTRGQRTGAGASLFASAPYQKIADLQGLFSTLRPQAAQAMTNIGSQAGQLGTQGLYSMLNALSGSTGAGQTIGTQQLQRKWLEGEASGATGNFLFELAKTIPWGSLFGGGKSKSTSAPIGSPLWSPQ